ncbi:MAG: transaldolase [Candidatus Bathyarchaeota archaeon]|nr:transaldolase [Candidatus Bathyarchaeota archaeon]
MEIFLDTASIKEIKDLLSWGVISGVTTNQKIFSCERGINFQDRVQEILANIDAPVSIEVTKTGESDEALVAEAKEYASWNPKNIVIKIPMFGNGRGLVLASKLHKENIKTNVTCLMTTNQVLLAALSGATYASIFFCRVRDAGSDPVKVIQDSKRILEESNLSTKIIVGSIRSPDDVAQAAAAGAHIITITPKVLAQMPFHQKTEDTIKEFDQAWLEFKKTEAQKIQLVIA